MTTNAKAMQQQIGVLKRRHDLKPDQFPDLDWESQKASESLKNVFKLAETQATNAIHWYLNARRLKRRMAQLCRFGAIFAVGLAGLLPIFTQIFTNNGKPVLEPAWASIILGLAALLVSFDRFFGFSTGWMRFIQAEHEIRKYLQEFQLEWNRYEAQLHGEPLSPEHVTERLALAKSFLTQTNEVVDQETKAWVTEFKDVLKQIDDSAKAKEVTERTGGINIIVKNSDATDQGWNLSIDEGAPKHFQGKNAALTGLAPGLRKIRVLGTIKGIQQSAEQAVSISAGGAASVELTLS